MQMIQAIRKWFKKKEIHQTQAMQADKFLAKMDIKGGFILFLANNNRLVFTQSPGLQSFEQIDFLIEQQYRVWNREVPANRSRYGMEAVQSDEPMEEWNDNQTKQ